jgi:hypothetical protein
MSGNVAAPLGHGHVSVHLDRANNNGSISHNLKDGRRGRCLGVRRRRSRGCWSRVMPLSRLTCCKKYAFTGFQNGRSNRTSELKEGSYLPPTTLVIQPGNANKLAELIRLVQQQQGLWSRAYYNYVHVITPCGKERKGHCRRQCDWVSCADRSIDRCVGCWYQLEEKEAEGVNRREDM